MTLPSPIAALEAAITHSAYDDPDEDPTQAAISVTEHLWDEGYVIVRSSLVGSHRILLATLTFVLGVGVGHFQFGPGVEIRPLLTGAVLAIGFAYGWLFRSAANGDLDLATTKRIIHH